MNPVSTLTGRSGMIATWLIAAASSVPAFILMRGPWAGAAIVGSRGLRAKEGTMSKPRDPRVVQGGNDA